MLTKRGQVELIVMGIPIVLIIFSIGSINIWWTILAMCIYFIALFYYEVKTL